MNICKPALLASGLCTALLLGGCANQLSQRSEQEQHAQRKLLEHHLQIDTAGGLIMELPQRRLRLLELKTFEVTDNDVTRHYDRYTPYQPWRELYEVPLGAVAVVAGVGANLVNVVALGQVPETATRGWIEYGVAGMNPLMNVESNGRAEQNLAAIEEHPQTTRKEHSSLPWAERVILIKANGQTHEMLSDRRGYLFINLLDGPFAEQDASSIKELTVIAEQTEPAVRSEVTLQVSPQLRSKLREAHALIYRDLEDDDAAQWVQRVKRLSELGLEDEASELEQSLIELTRNDPGLQREFLLRLAKDAGRLVEDPGVRP
jgi:hypothetical protein